MKLYIRRSDICVLKYIFYCVFQEKVEDRLDVPSIHGRRMTVLMKMRVFRIQGQHYYKYTYVCVSIYAGKTYLSCLFLLVCMYQSAL